MTNQAYIRLVENMGNHEGADSRDRLSRRVMAKEKYLILVVFLLVIGAAFGIQQLSSRGPAGAGGGAGAGAGGLAGGAIPPAPRKAPPVKQFRGFTIQLHSAAYYDEYVKCIDEMADTGANTVGISVAGYQENCSSTSIFIDARRGPSTDQLKSLINHAHQRKLRVMLMPIVLLENPRSGEWRGKISPRSWDDWWEDYNNYILHYAKLASQTHVEVLAVGSELISTEKDHADRWRGLIAAVRKTYKGYLIYSANWDHYRPVSWWDALDIVGMTTYYDLTSGKQPTVERLMKSWEPIKRDILQWQKTVNRPILFTEVGWPNQVTCAQYPWDYTRSPGQPDPKSQANCFDAFFRTWIDEPSVAGFLVWEWRSSPGQVVDPQKDCGYVPGGKPAMAVIEKYFDQPDPLARLKAPAPQSQPGPRLDMPTTAPADGQAVSSTPAPGKTR